MTDEHPKADRRRRNAIEKAASGLESEYLKNVIIGRLWFDPNPVLHIADAMERAYGIGEENMAESTDAQRKAVEAARHLDDALDLEAAAAVFDVIKQIADDEIPLQNYPGKPGGPAMEEAIDIVVNGALPADRENDE